MLVGQHSDLVACHFADYPQFAGDAAKCLCEIGNIFVFHRGSTDGPAYGAQKAGIDKLAHDMEHDLRGTGVIAVSIWLGMQITERSQISAKTNPEQYEGFLAMAENPEFTAHILDAIDKAPNREALSGETLIGAEIARQLGVQDRGQDRLSHRDMLGSPRTKNPAAVY